MQEERREIATAAGWTLRDVGGGTHTLNVATTEAGPVTFRVDSVIDKRHGLDLVRAGCVAAIVERGRIPDCVEDALMDLAATEADRKWYRP